MVFLIGSAASLLTGRVHITMIVCDKGRGPYVERKKNDPMQP